MKLFNQIIVGSLMASSVLAYATTYEIDPAHANVRFAIDHFGTSTNTGGFYNLTGKVEYDPNAQIGKVDLVIPIDNLNTGNAEFDKHLKSSDFFDLDVYPIARFVSTKWYFANEGNKQKVTHIDGKLTVNGTTAPVTLTATKFNCYFSPVYRKQVCGGDFVTTIDRTDWGINKYVLMGMTKDVMLNIQIEAIKQ